MIQEPLYNIVEFSIKSATGSTQQIDKANCGIVVCVCFLNIDLRQKEDRYLISTYQKPWSNIQHVWLRWMPGKLESELTPNGPLVPGAHAPNKMGMLKHFPKHAPQKTNQMTI